MTTPMTVTSTVASPATTGAVDAAPDTAAPAAPAPAPAPVVETSLDAAAAPAPVAESASPAPAPAAGAAVNYEPTGDAGLDFALGFLGRLGYSPEAPAMKAAEAGNFALLRAELALLGDKAQGWEQVVALGEQSFKSMQASRVAAEQKTQDAILSAFGQDKDEAAKQWAEVREWAKANAEPEERAAVNAALQAGGIAAKAMAAYLNGLYRAHPSAVIEPATVTRVGGNSGNDSAALSPTAYREAVLALRGKLGQGMDSSPEYKALQARRLAYRA